MMTSSNRQRIIDKQELESIQKESEVIDELIVKRKEEEQGEYEIFKLDDDGYYPGLTKEESEQAAAHITLGKTLTAMAEADINTKAIK